jgi:hypothetical protein
MKITFMHANSFFSDCLLRCRFLCVMIFDIEFQSHLVCDRRADRTHAVMAFMAGLTGGSLVTGFISDL